MSVLWIEAIQELGGWVGGWVGEFSAVEHGWTAIERQYRRLSSSFFSDFSIRREERKGFLCVGLLCCPVVLTAGPWVGGWVGGWLNHRDHKPPSFPFLNPSTHPPTPTQREEVLLQATDDVLATLPPNLVAEAQVVRERAALNHQRARQAQVE